MNVAKFLRIDFSIEHLRWLLLDKKKKKKIEADYMGNGKVSEEEYGNEEANCRRNNFQIMNIKEKVAEVGET